jgi:hypothetical protein
VRDSFVGRAFHDAAHVVFTTTPDTDTGLRNLVVQRVSAEKERYCLAAKPDLNEALEGIPGFASGVLRYEATLRPGVTPMPGQFLRKFARLSRLWIAAAVTLRTKR